MILVLAGTQDGREIVEYLLQKNYPVMASVVSDYGKALLSDSPIKVSHRPLPENELKSLLKENKVDTIIDATHPYAINISTIAMRIAAELSLKYIRYERQVLPLPDYEKLFIVKNYHEAARKAAALGKNVFLTTGSRNLKAFSSADSLKQHNLIARVLPDAAVIQECISLGISPKQIIAMQGPFSHELNKELYKKYQTDVIVTKNSGFVGGTDTKLTAAIELGLPVVMIDRPIIKYPVTVMHYEEIINLLED